MHPTPTYIFWGPLELGSFVNKEERGGEINAKTTEVNQARMGSCQRRNDKEDSRRLSRQKRSSS